jgi:hypothetical protein
MGPAGRLVSSNLDTLAATVEESVKVVAADEANAALSSLPGVQSLPIPFAAVLWRCAGGAGQCAAGSAAAFTAIPSPRSAQLQYCCISIR